jgi:ATP-dependent Zn protease
MTVSEIKFETNSAFHEAAHAVVALVLGIKVNRVSIQKAPGQLGYCDFSFKNASHNHLIAAALAGGIIEHAAGGLHWLYADQLISDEDKRVIDDACFALGIRGDREKQNYVYDVRRQTEELLERKEIRLAIGEIATALLQRKELDGPTVREIVGRHISLNGVCR